MPTRARSTKERGYTGEHTRRRAALRVLVEAGHATCCLCFNPILPGQPWDLDHTPDRTGYRGAAHRRCNRADGGRRGNRVRSARRRRVRAVFGPLSQ